MSWTGLTWDFARAPRRGSPRQVEQQKRLCCRSSTCDIHRDGPNTQYMVYLHSLFAYIYQKFKPDVGIYKYAIYHALSVSVGDGPLPLFFGKMMAAPLSRCQAT